jgi:2-keto-4-pentenoate hydratase
VSLDPRVALALRRQLDRRAAALDAGARRVGWKLGAQIAEIEAVTGGEPVIGYLTSATVVSDGGIYDVRNAAELRAETELVFDAAGLAVGLELVDTARPPHGLDAIVANNVFHLAVVLGERRARTAGAEARLFVDGELRAAARVTTDVEAVRARVGALLEDLDLQLRPEDRVLAGSLTHVPVAAGSEVRAEIDGLGGVSIRLAE